jgi:hypothetical protein
MDGSVMERDVNASPRGEKSSQGLLLPWTWISLSLLVASLTLLGTLAVIADRQSANALSTTALALAVLSFSAQLIVTMAQGYGANQQMSQIDNLNADTKASLAEIRATCATISSSQREQFDHVLRAALRTMAPEKVIRLASTEIDLCSHFADPAAVKQLKDLLTASLCRGLIEVVHTAGVADRPRFDDPLWSREVSHCNSHPLYDRLSNYPREERGLAILPVLESLSAQDAAAFSRIATQLSEQTRKGKSPRLLIESSGRQRESLMKLSELGLIQVADSSREAASGTRRYWIELTDLGVDLGGLVLGQGGVPTWLSYA